MDDQFKQLQDWLSLWTAKNEETIDKVYKDDSISKEERRKIENKLETDLITRFKMILLGTTDACYWHLFYSQNIESVLPEGRVDDTCKNQQFMIEFNLPQFKKFKNPKRLFAFTRKGLDDPMWTLVPSAWKEIVTFVAMFSMFLTFMSCPKDGVLDETDFLHRNICADRKSIVSYAALAVIMMVMYTMYKRRVEKSKKDAAKRANAEREQRMNTDEKKLK